MWDRGEAISIINYYNPCKRLDLNNLLRIGGQDGSKIIWCADFNAHSSIWGSIQMLTAR